MSTNDQHALSASGPLTGGAPVHDTQPSMSKSYQSNCKERRSNRPSVARKYHTAGWEGRHSWFHRNQFNQLSPANQDEPQPPMPERWDEYCWSEKLTLVTAA